jgi:hypothetical protein
MTMVDFGLCGGLIAAFLFGWAFGIRTTTAKWKGVVDDALKVQSDRRRYL